MSEELLLPFSQFKMQLQTIKKSLDRSADECGHSLRECWSHNELEIENRIQNKLPLSGVPFVLKDNFCTQQGESCCGSLMLKGYRSPFDCTSYQLLQNAGALCTGKANMDEMSIGISGMTCAYAHPTNPWDHTKNAGGSSTGSAIAVATGAAQFSLGTDTGGSVRNPAAHCGVLGLKPTHGRISRHGVIALSSSFDTIGIFARHAKDMRAILTILNKRDSKDLRTLHVPQKLRELSKPSVKGTLLAIPRNLEKYCTSEVLDTFNESRLLLEKRGIKFVEIDFDHFQNSLDAYAILCAAEAYSNLSRYDGIRYGPELDLEKDYHSALVAMRTEHFGFAVKERITLGAYVLEHKKHLSWAMNFQKKLMNEISEIEDNYNGIFLPSTPHTAQDTQLLFKEPELARKEDLLLSFVNLVGRPAISFPIGYNSNCMPIGAQLITAPWEEGQLLEIVDTYQENTDHHLRLANTVKGSTHEC